MVALSLAGSAILLFSCDDRKAAPAAGGEESLMTEYSENLSMVVSQNGRRSYFFETPLLEGYTMAREPYREFRKGVKITTYQNDSLSSVDVVLTANYAIYYENRELWEAKGNVVAEKSDGKKLYTQQLFWNAKTKKIYSNVDSKIVQNEGRDVFVGEGFESDEEFKDWRFRRMKGRMEVDVTQRERSDSLTTDTLSERRSGADEPYAGPHADAQRSRRDDIRERAGRDAAQPASDRSPMAEMPAAGASAAQRSEPSVPARRTATKDLQPIEPREGLDSRLVDPQAGEDASRRKAPRGVAPKSRKSADAPLAAAMRPQGGDAATRRFVADDVVERSISLAAQPARSSQLAPGLCVAPQLHSGLAMKSVQALQSSGFARSVQYAMGLCVASQLRSGLTMKTVQALQSSGFVRSVQYAMGLCVASQLRSGSAMKSLQALQAGGFARSARLVQNMPLKRKSHLGLAVRFLQACPRAAERSLRFGASVFVSLTERILCFPQSEFPGVDRSLSLEPNHSNHCRC